MNYERETLLLSLKFSKPERFASFDFILIPSDGGC